MILASSMTLVTYGGGEILTKIFQSLAMLFNGGQDGLARPLMLICASLGGFYALSKSFFSGTYEGLILQYCFPFLVIASLFLVPTTTVHIEDVLRKVGNGGELRSSSYSVSHVPLLLGKFAETVSTLGYRLSEKIDSVMHVPNDPSYHSTGMIFGSEASLDMTRYQLANADLEQNFRQFSKQCVLYDIALGRYTIDELKKETDLWKLFENKTSQVRMIRYCPPGSNLTQCTYETCKDAITKMKPFFEKEQAHYAKLEIGKNLPLTFQALTGLQTSAKELIGQQLTLNVLTDVLSKGHFAKKRAYDQQQSTYRTMGALAANGLVTMRIVFEALIYGAFVFILPISLFPGGIKYLINWAWLTVWIQMWPPLYTILNYVMLLAGRAKVDGWISSLSVDQQGLSLFTSIGMQNLNDEIFALAGFLGASVPYLSYILLKGGLSSFVQLAGSLTAPAQQAAGSAASELTSGNYSFANTNYGQTSFANAHAFQTQMSPSISAGYFTHHQGDMSATYSANPSPILTQSTSALRTSVMSDETIGQSFQTQKQEAQSYLETASENYLNSMAASSRLSSDLITHAANSKNFSDSLSDRESYSMQESASQLHSIAEDWGKQFGFNTKESLEILGSAGLSGGAGIPFLEAKLGGSGSFGRATSRDEVISSAQHLAGRKDFQHHLQKVGDYSQSHAINTTDDIGQRISKAYADSLDIMQNHQDSYQLAKSRMEQVSENEAWFKQNSHLIKRSLNDDFIQWANNKMEGGLNHVLDTLSRDRPEEIQPLIQDFIHDLRKEMPSPPAKYETFTENLHAEGTHLIDRVEEETKNVIGNIQHHSERESHETITTKNLLLEQDYHRAEDSHHSQTSKIKDSIQHEREEKIKNFDTNNEGLIIGKLWEGPNKTANLSNQVKISEAPFWMEKE